MFIKTTINYVCFWSILVAMLTSCQEEYDLETAASVPIIAEQPGVVVEDGMIHFKNQSAWEATIQKMQETDYVEYVTALGFENSLLAKYDAIEESDELLDDYFKSGKLPQIQDDLFASLLNEEAMVKIGNTLYKVTDDYTFSVVDEDGSMLKQFREKGASLNKLAKVSTFENVDYLADKTMIVENIVNGVKTTVARFQGEQKYYVLDPEDNLKRVLVGAWSRTYGVYSSVGIKLIAERYRKGGVFGGSKWRNYDANYLFCYGEAFTQLCRGPIVDCDDKALKTGGAIKYNSHRVQKTIDTEDIPIPGAYWHVTDYIDGTYRYRFYSGGPVHETRFRFK